MRNGSNLITMHTTMKNASFHVVTGILKASTQQQKHKHGRAYTRR